MMYILKFPKTLTRMSRKNKYIRSIVGMHYRKNSTRRAKKGGSWFGNIFKRNTSRNSTRSMNDPTILNSNSPRKFHNINITNEKEKAKEYFNRSMGNNVNYSSIQNKNTNVVNQLVNSVLHEYFEIYESDLTNKEKQNIRNYVKNSVTKRNTRSRSNSLASDPGPVNNTNENIRWENVEITNMPAPKKIFQNYTLKRGFANRGANIMIKRSVGQTPEVVNFTRRNKKF